MLRSILTVTLLAGALLAPTAGAQPKTRPGSAPTAGNAGASDGGSMCAFLRDEANAASDAAQANYAAGNRKRGRRFQHVADADYQEAHDLGCAWAA